MANLFYNISQVLGITIIHSLWQGLLVYFLLRFLLQCFPGMPSAKKYDFACMALVAVVVWFIYTLLTEINNYNWHPSTQTIIPSVFQLPLSALPVDNRYYFMIARYLPFITVLYFTGLLLNTLKFAWAWRKIRRVKQALISSNYQDMIHRYAQKLNITKAIGINFSGVVDVPCIIGYFKPIILLPLSLTTTLSEDEIEAIILHELAHIRRNDYLFNLIQQAVSIVLFFNPFSHLINRLINNERENCCDDMVIQITCEPLIYAKALLKIEETRQQDWQLALAATGKKYHLLNRIERIMKTKSPIGNIRPIIIALLLFAGSLSSIAWLNPKIENGKLSVKMVVHPPLGDLYIDTIRKKSVKTDKPADKINEKKRLLKSDKRYKATADHIVNDEKLNELAAEVEKHGEAINKYYSSPEFMKLEEDMEKKGKEMEAFYNQPKFKQMQEDQAKSEKGFEKWNNSPDFKAMEKKMAELGMQMTKNYQGPEFNALTEKMAKEGEWMGEHSNLDPNSAEFKQHQQALKKAAEAMKGFNNTQAFKQQQEQMKVLQEKLTNEYLNNPQYKKQMESVKAFADSIKKAYQNPATKQQMADLQQLSQQMRDYQNRPEIAKEKQLMKEAAEKMRQYQNSPAYKERVKELEKQGIDERRQSSDQPRHAETPGAEGSADAQAKMRSDAPERMARVEIRERSAAPERPERPEAKERVVAERRERPEVAERVEFKVIPDVKIVAPAKISTNVKPIIIQDVVIAPPAAKVADVVIDTTKRKP